MSCCVPDIICPLFLPGNLCPCDQVDVEIPRELSDEQRELITELKKERDAHANDGKGGFFSSLGL